MIRAVALTARLAAPADAVWSRAATLAGVNLELRPLIRMTAPARLRGASLADLTPGAPARSSTG